MSTAPVPTRLGDLGPVVAELVATTGTDETTIAQLIERAVVDACARLLPDTAVVARVDLATSTLRLERRSDDPEVEPLELAVSGDLARHAAQAVKSAIAGLLRDAERGRVVREGTGRRGELADAIVEHRDGRTWHLHVDDLEAVLPAHEQIADDVMERGRHLKVLVLDVRRRGRDAVLEVSRTHPDLLRRLLEQEVPELAAGTVVVRGLVRDPGRRAKVAVDTPSGGLDAEGACIGPRGVRIRAVCGELGEEQVHIVGWSSDPAVYVARSLGPATVTAVELDEETRTAHVTVPAGQLSLAIGRGGENARLAARLTGWRIDIRAEEGLPA